MPPIQPSETEDWIIKGDQDQSRQRTPITIKSAARLDSSLPFRLVLNVLLETLPQSSALCSAPV
jgi:hypothetical protein